MKNFKKSVVIPIALLVYLAAIAWISRDRFYAGEYLHYFGVLGVSLLIIIALHFVFKKKERLKEERERDLEETYSTYEEEDKKKD
ncbi:MAG: hypothetical protein HUK12_05925 [Muribaculaceae bacterium]|nr:hypothetical protein [Muribaculaceae bacterium]